ncbi:YfiR family protein [Candidatus Entotheonella palauensis]|uniref:YfiR family protein n=1 Tax=Candidatus Entotheonella palauensis TaxID=93172 RepID=UPI0015C45993|nr:YfiR family protein [Candidatus Entotheonella palauensis]
MSLVLMLLSTTVQPASKSALVKVAYLYKFAKFVEWPAGAFEPETQVFALCVLGTDSFVGALPSIEGKPIQGRKLEIKYFAQEPPGQGCQILFVSSSEAQRLSAILTDVELTPSLTVADIERFTRLGGMINFITQGHKTRFAINIKAAQRAGLQIRSKLLKLATIVDTDPS